MNHSSEHHISSGPFISKGKQQDLSGPRISQKEQLQHGKNFQVMRDLKDLDCLPKRKQRNEIMIEVHKTTSGLETRKLPLTSFLNASTRGHSMKPTGDKF